jgi:hypothetical protein
VVIRYLGQSGWAAFRRQQRRCADEGRGAGLAERFLGVTSFAFGPCWAPYDLATTGLPASHMCFVYRSRSGSLRRSGREPVGWLYAGRLGAARASGRITLAFVQQTTKRSAAAASLRLSRARSPEAPSRRRESPLSIGDFGPLKAPAAKLVIGVGLN